MKSTLVSMHRAMERGDDAGFVQWYDAPETDKAFLRKMMPAIRKLHALDRAAVAAYGDAAWRKAAGGKKIGLGFATAAEIDKDVEIKVEGDTAICIFRKRRADPMKMVRKNGRWLAVLPAGVRPTGTAEQRQVVRVIEAMGQAADQTRLMVGKAGVTAEDVMRVLGERMMKALTAGMK